MDGGAGGLKSNREGDGEDTKSPARVRGEGDGSEHQFTRAEQREMMSCSGGRSVSLS